MLELKDYTIDEMRDYLGSDRLDCIKSKLETIECKYETYGRGEKRTFKITKLPNQFKEFCIYELGIPPQTDFVKLKNFLYFYFFSDGFFTFPIQEMENILHRVGKPISRQTFTEWITMLQNHNLIMLDNSDCKYFACCHTDDGKYYVREISEKQYKAAWSAYYKALNDPTKGVAYAAATMKNMVGGKAVKRPIPKANAITYDKLETLMKLVLSNN